MARKGKPVSAARTRTSKTLFEAMSRAPQAETIRTAPGLSSIWTRRPTTPAGQVVAQPMSEQEAMAELAEREAQRTRREQEVESQKAERQARQAEKQARREAQSKEKQELRAQRAARKAAMKAARAQAGAAVPRFNLSLSTAACVGGAGLICALVLAAYSLGRHSKAELGTVAAIKEPPAKAAPSKKRIVAENVKAKIPANSHPDLAQLLDKPEPVASKGVMVNEAVSVSSKDAAATLSEDMNYLQIESFLVTRDRNGDQLAADLAHARSFLAEHGMKTFARKRSNGYVLFCEQGVATGKDHATERDTLRKRVQQLGQEYRAAGGLYGFKGCLFVSFSSTKAGDPV